MSRREPSERERFITALDEARSLIRLGWCQKGPAARRGGGTLTNPEHELAAAWSPIGAIQRVCARRGVDWTSPFALSCLRALRDVLAVEWTGINTDVQTQTGICHEIADWNDAEDRTHAQVILAFDMAVGLAAKLVKPLPGAA